MFKVLVPAVAALGLVLFAAQSGAGASPAGTAVGGPVMGWSVHHEGALAKLAYGVANTDQLALMVTCMPGDANAVVYGDVQPEGARPAQAGPAAQPADPLSGGAAIETRITLSDPALLGLARQGRMAVRGEPGVLQIAATPDERRLVADFLAYCSPVRA